MYPRMMFVWDENDGNLPKISAKAIAHLYTLKIWKSLGMAFLYRSQHFTDITIQVLLLFLW